MERRIRVLATHAMCAVLAAWATAEDSAKQSNWQPKPAPPQWGNTKADSTIDYLDLIDLGQHWEEADTHYGRTRDTLLQELREHWNAPVPALLQHDTWDNRPLLGGGFSPPVAGGKQGAVPVAIGFGVSIQNNRNWVVGRQLYPAPSTGPNAITFSLNTQTLPGAGGALANDPRYDPIVSEEFESKFISSFQEEQDFKSFDMSLEISSALYDGGVSTDFARNQYKSVNSFKYIAKAKVDFGWFYVPQDKIALFDGVVEDLSSANPLLGLQRYGTHYVFADHRFAELYIEVDIGTKVSRDTKQFGADIDAHYIGFADVDFVAATRSVQSSLGLDTSVSVTFSRRGGPNEIRLSDGTLIPFDISLSPDDSTFARLPEILTAWRSAINATNAARDDYYLRPISDFIDGAYSLPFEKTANLRRWFSVYLKMDGQLRTLVGDPDSNVVGILTTAGLPEPVYSTSYRHFNYIPMANDALRNFYGTGLNYHRAMLSNYRTTLPYLIDFGRRLYEGEETAFYASDPRWELWSLEIPKLTITWESLADQWNPRPATDYVDNAWSPVFYMPGNFTAGNNYATEFVCGAGYGSLPEWSPAHYDEATGITAVQYQLKTNADGHRLLANSNYAGCSIRVRDTINPSHPIVAYECLNPACQGVVLE